MRPEEALAAARAAAAARAGDDDDLPGLEIEPTDAVSAQRLLEWAVIEPDLESVRSTRRRGAPITWLKRALIHVLRQYLRQIESQQTRFNLQVALKIVHLEERVRGLERGRPDP